jgi:hypothetical protein
MCLPKRYPKKVRHGEIICTFIFENIPAKSYYLTKHAVADLFEGVD